MNRPELSAEDRAYLTESRRRSGVDPERVRDAQAIQRVAALVKNSQQTTVAPGGDGG